MCTGAQVEFTVGYGSSRFFVLDRHLFPTSSNRAWLGFVFRLRALQVRRAVLPSITSIGRVPSNVRRLQEVYNRWFRRLRPGSYRRAYQRGSNLYLAEFRSGRY